MHIHNKAYCMIRKSLVCVILLAAAILSAQEAQAVVNATSTTRNIAINQSASVQVKWQVGVATPVGTPVNSPQGTLSIPAGSVLLRINRTVSGKTTVPQGPNSSIFTANEALLIPACVIAKARAAGINQISYERTFTPGGKGTILFNITGSAGAGFSISREALSFTDK